MSFEYKLNMYVDPATPMIRSEANNTNHRLVMTWTTMLLMSKHPKILSPANIVFVKTRENERLGCQRGCEWKRNIKEFFEIKDGDSMVGF